MLAFPNKNNGFTLLETIIYIGLFSLIFTGIFASINPLFSGAKRLTIDVTAKGETAFILSKIDYALLSSITSQRGVITTPAEGGSAAELIIEYDSIEKFHFKLDDSNAFCTPPLICQMLTLSKNNEDALPLNASRVQIENFSVTHVAPLNRESRYLDVTFTAEGKPVGPIRYYLHF